MGHRRKSKVYKLVWPEDHENHGLEVCVKSLSTAELMRLGSLADKDLTEDLSPEAMAALEDMMRLFASKLVKWNLEDEDGEPVPATYEGLNSQELDFTMELIDAWMNTVAGIAAPLGANSSAGNPALEASLPMEPLSESQAS